MIKLSRILKLPSTGEDVSQVQDYVTEVCSKMPDVTYQTDVRGNVYLTKGNDVSYPVIVSVMDFKAENFKIHRLPKNVWTAYTVSRKNPVPVTIAPSKTGLFLALKVLESATNLKVLLLKSQDDNYASARNCDFEFLDNAKWVISLDRHGDREFVTKTGTTNLCSSEFEGDILKFASKHGFTATSGGRTDLTLLVENKLPVDAVNMTTGVWKSYAGFYQIPESGVLRTLDLLETLVKELDIKYVRSKTVTRIKSCNKGCGAKVFNQADYYCSSCIRVLQRKCLKCKGCVRVLNTQADFYTEWCVGCRSHSKSA